MIGVREDLFGETFSLFVVSQSSSWFLYACRLVDAVLCLGCCSVTLGSSAYDMICLFGSRGAGMSCM